MPDAAHHLHQCLGPRRALRVRAGRSPCTTVSSSATGSTIPGRASAGRCRSIRAPSSKASSGPNPGQRLSVNPGFFRQTRLVATAMLLAVALICHNLVSLHVWHTERGRPEPWQIHPRRTRRRPPSRLGHPDPQPTQIPQRLTGPPRELASRTAVPACPETRQNGETGPTAYEMTAVTGQSPVQPPKLPAGSPPTGSFGKLKQVGQGTTQLVGAAGGQSSPG